MALPPYLPQCFVDARFDFFGRTLSGVPMIKTRWKRGVRLVEEVLGDALGRLYVDRHFPPAHKARVDAMVADLLEAYRRSISALDWMTEATKREALAKLSSLRALVGYPTHWREYNRLNIERDDLVGNFLAHSAFTFDENLIKLARPVDRSEWSMTPQAVNAYYHPLRNVIVFPAAILQPPLFDQKSPDAANYGAIGAVIGHEIGHAFDDKGSATDSSGELRDWWTDGDKAAFRQRTGLLEEQYSVLCPDAAPEVHLGDCFLNGGLGLA